MQFFPVETFTYLRKAVTSARFQRASHGVPTQFNSFFLCTLHDWWFRLGFLFISLVYDFGAAWSCLRPVCVCIPKEIDNDTITYLQFSLYVDFNDPSCTQLKSILSLGYGYWSTWHGWACQMCWFLQDIAIIFYNVISPVYNLYFSI